MIKIWAESFKIQEEEWVYFLFKNPFIIFVGLANPCLDDRHNQFGIGAIQFLQFSVVMYYSIVSSMQPALGGKERKELEKYNLLQATLASKAASTSKTTFRNQVLHLILVSPALIPKYRDSA